MNRILVILLVLIIAGGAYYLGTINKNNGSQPVVEEPVKLVSVEKKNDSKPTTASKTNSVEDYLENANFKQANELLEKTEEASRDRNWKLLKVRALEGLGETQTAIQLLDSLHASSNRAQKASIDQQKAQLLLDSGEKKLAGDLYFQIFKTYSDSREGEDAALKLKDLWKSWQSNRDISSTELVKYNNVLSWMIQNTIDEGILNECYQILERINTKIFFSPIKVDGLVDFHTVSYGENLSSIAQKFSVAPDRISRINGLKSRNAIRAGQVLRVIQGRVKLVVDKKRFNLDVYLDDLFFKRYPVGLGRGGNTPVVITQLSRSMAKNPDYTVPDTGELIEADDPRNPIGTRWAGFTMGRGYGIHGTREPDSIGKESSNGCVRMLNSDIEYLYDFMMVGDEVEIK